jgi:A/G-specific adenine glycosylase
MAQQTQIVRVDDAWTGFMRRFPTSRAVAAAPTADVLRAWAGLGYNRRAVNLQRAAAAIETEHCGRVPDEVGLLEALPGVGPYTARAVAAIAFDVPVAPVDTNVRRVITRVLGEPLTTARLQLEADRLVPREAAAAWTHASMELGATVCVARVPRCHACPLRAWCASAGMSNTRRGRQATAAKPFEQTTRWLRGRIVDLLRALEDDTWDHLPPAIGDHGEAAIRAAVAGLERDGLLERHPDGSVRLPSGTT